MVGKWLGAVLGGCLLAVGLAASASADTIICNDPNACTFSLDNFIGSGNAPPGPYGSISLVQNGSNVDVSVTLTAGNYFAVTGAGEALLWDFAGNPDISGQVHLTGSSIGNFTFDTPSGNQDGSGDWNYGWICSACGQGGSPPHINSLTFTIDSATLAEFIANDKGFSFASDLCIGLQDNKCTVTGDVIGDLMNNNVPEPASLMLFGSGLLGAALIRRRRQAKR